MNIPFRNIRQLLSLQAKVAPDKVFLTTIGAEGEREELTYAEFNARAHQAANLLHTDFGVQAGDVVAIIDDQPGDVAVLLMACWLIGAVAVPLCVEEPGEVSTHQLWKSGAKVCLIRHPYLPAWQHEIQSHWKKEIQHIWKTSAIIQMGGQADALYPHFSTLVRNLPNTLLSDEAEPLQSSPALLVPGNIEGTFTTLTQHHLLTAGNALASAQAISGNQRLINYWPVPDQYQPYYTTAHAVNIFMAALWSSASLTLNWDFKPNEFWHEVAAQRLHIACLNADHLHQLIEFARQQQAAGNPIYSNGIYQQDIKHLRHILCSSSGLIPELVRTFLNLFPIPILVGYSSGSTAGFSCLMPWHLPPDEYRHWIYDHEPLCIGRPLDGCDIAIHDNSGNELSLAQPGHIMLRCDSKTEWLATGETGYYLYDRYGYRVFFRELFSS